ncbi:MAG: translesion error-prone DNA polymerase V autoproteolytic subunit [Chitinophagaceae bacterium]
MESELFFGPAYKGTKQFVQQDVPTANATGFGAAADDYMERGIDLNEKLIMNKPATFFFRMNSDSMEGAGIGMGDVLIVDRSIPVANGKIIIAAVDGELLIRRYYQSFNKKVLAAENKRYKNIELTEYSQFITWGVVTCVIHIMEPALESFAKEHKRKQNLNIIE